MDTLQTLTAKLDQERQRQQDRLEHHHKQNPEMAQHFGDLKTQLDQQDLALKEKTELSHKQASKIEALTKEMAEMEDQLNKSYNDTLDQMVKQITDLQVKLSKANKEADMLHSSTAPARAEKETNLRRIQELEAQLASAQAQIKEQGSQNTHLKREATTSTASSYKVEEQAKTIQTLQREIAALQARVREQDQQILVAANSNAKDAKIKELMEQVSVLEFRLKVANQVADFLKTSLSQSEDERILNAERAGAVEAQLAELKVELKASQDQAVNLEFQLSETNRISKYLQTNLQKTRKAKEESDNQAKEATEKLEVTEGSLKEMENKVAQTTFRVTETDRVLKFVQSSLERTKKQKDDMENNLQGQVAQKEFKITETNRVLSFVQNALEKTKQQKDKLENDMEGKIAKLEFSLSEANRVAKFLQRSADRVSQEKMTYKDLSKELQAELTHKKSQLAERTVEIADLHTASKDKDQKMTDLAQNIIDLEGRLSVADRVAEFLTANLSETQEAKKYNDTKAVKVAEELAVTSQEFSTTSNKLADTAFRLKETERILKFVQQSLEKSKTDKAAMENKLEGQVAQKEFKITETNRVLGFIQNTLTKIKAEKEQNENSLEGKIAALEFRLKESNRVASFLQSNLTRVKEQKNVQVTKACELSQELADLKKELAAKVETISCQATASAEQVAQVESMVSQVTDCESRLSVTNRVAEFLQVTLSRTEEEKRVNDHKLDEATVELVALRDEFNAAERKILDREFRLKETERILRFVKQSLEKTKQDKDKMQNDLEGQIAQKEFKVTEANRVLSFLQQAFEKTQKEKKENENRLEDSVAQLEFKLKESNRVAGFLQSSANKIHKDKVKSETKAKALEAELSSLKDMLLDKEDMIESSNRDSNEHRSAVELVQKRVTDLHAKLSVANNLTEFLQGALTKTEESKRSADDEVRELHSQVALLQAQLRVKDATIAQLEINVKESARMSDFLQERMARVETERKELSMKNIELTSQVHMLQTRLSLSNGSNRVGYTY